MVESEGKQYPVEIFYENQHLSQSFDTSLLGKILIQALMQHTGGVLVFVPGQREVRQLLEWIDQSKHSIFTNAVNFPLYGSLTLQQQMRQGSLPT